MGPVQISEITRLRSGLLAFFVFSLCASAPYLLNDLLDLEADRAHPRKKNRPFASGELSILSGVVVLAAMSVSVAALAAWLPRTAAYYLAVYAMVNVAYSVRLKRVLFLDVITLVGLYALRILFGGVATSIPVSIWTAAFSVFIFLGLALLKRLNELKGARDAGTDVVLRRPYIAADLSIVQSFACAALYISVLIMALYINSLEVLKLYSRIEPLWAVCLLLIFWVSRMLLLTNRGQMTDDPIVFAFRDRGSQVVALSVLLCIVIAL